MKKLKNYFDFCFNFIDGLFKHRSSTLILCECCESPFVKYYGVDKCETKDYTIVEYKVVCSKCGTVGTIVEKWEK